MIKAHSESIKRCLVKKKSLFHPGPSQPDPHWRRQPLAPTSFIFFHKNSEHKGAQVYVCLLPFLLLPPPQIAAYSVHCFVPYFMYLKIMEIIPYQHTCICLILPNSWRIHHLVYWKTLRWLPILLLLKTLHGITLYLQVFGQYIQENWVNTHQNCWIIWYLPFNFLWSNFE